MGINLRCIFSVFMIYRIYRAKVAGQGERTEAPPTTRNKLLIVNLDGDHSFDRNYAILDTAFLIALAA